MKKNIAMLLLVLLGSKLFSQNMLQRSNSIKGKKDQNSDLTALKKDLSDIKQIDTATKGLQSYNSISLNEISSINDSLLKISSTLSKNNIVIRDLDSSLGAQIRSQRESQESTKKLKSQIAAIEKEIKGGASKNKSQLLSLKNDIDKIKKEKELQEIKLISSTENINLLTKKLEDYKDSSNSLKRSNDIFQSIANDRKNQITGLQKIFFDRALAYYKESITDLTDNYKAIESNLNKLDAALKNVNWFNQQILAEEQAKELLLETYNLSTKNEKYLTEIADFKKELEAYKDNLTEFESFHRIINKKLIGASDLNTRILFDYFGNIEKIDSILISEDAKLRKKLLTIQENTIKYQNHFDNTVAKANKFNEKKEENSDKGGLFAGLNKVLNEDGIVIPDISLVASRKIEEASGTNFIAQIKLFTAPETGSSKYNTDYNLFIPEASTFGLMTDFNWGFIPSNRNSKQDNNTGRNARTLGLSASLYYLGKKFETSDSTRFSMGVFHAKVGSQVILIPNALSVYGNLNCLYSGNNIEKFNKYYPMTDPRKQFRWFVDFGLSTYLELSQKQEFKLFFDLGFISVGNDVKEIINSRDKLIPKFRLNLVKDFSF